MTDQTQTVEERLTKNQRVLWIRTVLTITDTEPQRRAFITGYNGGTLKGRRSPEMIDRYRLGREVYCHIQEQGS